MSVVKDLTATVTKCAWC